MFADTQIPSERPIDTSTYCEIQTRWACGEFVGVFKYGGKVCRTKEAERNLNLFASKVTRRAKSTSAGHSNSVPCSF